MKKFNCPSCGAEAAFHSSLSVYAVCAYCRSMLVRRDVDVESIGTMAALPDDMSPLQIGTEGYYAGVRFTLIGRMKIGWEDGTWNEWFMMSDDGRKGWLAEAQGFYAACFEIEDGLHPNAERAFENPEGLSLEEDPMPAPRLGSYITLNDAKLKVVDVKQAVCIGSEGELPFAAPQGRKTQSIDLLGPDGEFACIEMEGDKRRVYLGHYLEWDEMNCRNSRVLEGWQ
ncbi:MAG TPA: DUF4178 domain-containing protein [Micavibrio sp.]